MDNVDEIIAKMAADMTANEKAAARKTQVKKEIIKSEVSVGLNGLKATTLRGPVNMNSLSDVQKRTEEYLEACSLSGTFPSVMGLSSYGFGRSKGYLSNWLRNNPGTEVAEYIEMVKEIFADILTNASLNGSANVIQTIFQLKNHFGHEDHVKVEASRPSIMGSARSREEIEMRYKSIVVDD